MRHIIFDRLTCQYVMCSHLDLFGKHFTTTDKTFVVADFHKGETFYCEVLVLKLWDFKLQLDCSM
jgi:hypothetical protein